jgi:hypothetical protein
MGQARTEQSEEG